MFLYLFALISAPSLNIDISFRAVQGRGGGLRGKCCWRHLYQGMKQPPLSDFVHK